MQNLTVSLIQSDLIWEDKEKNISHFTGKIREIEEATDLIVLPEMFTTGFAMEPQKLAEPMGGPTIQWMHRMATEKNCVLAGSIIIKENNHFFNRLIWMRSDGSYDQVDKKHLFTFAGENKHYTQGNKKLIVTLKGWRIMPLICYDLRFPVWSKNRHDAENGFDYDCMINVANWPEKRSHVWRILLMARALENQSYVIGINRIGKDGNDIGYSGDSAVISPKGENLSNMAPCKEQTETVVMSRCELDNFRDNFRAWADWDQFQIV